MLWRADPAAKVCADARRDGGLISICCTDVTRLPGLESIRFRAGLQGGNRVVRWPYVAENDSIADWVSGGELVFVTGINRRRNEQNLKQLVREGARHQVAGLVILTGPEFIREIPASVLELANRLDFPILEQPYDLKMVVVTEVISNAIVQDNLMGQSVKLFLNKLINGFAEAPELIHLRATELGLSDSRPYSVVALRLLRQTTDIQEQRLLLQQRNRLEQILTDLLKRRGIEWPVLLHEHDLLAIWPCDEAHAASLAEELEQAVQWLLRQQPELNIYAGVSDLQPGLSRLSQAVDQACQAAQFAVQHQHQRLFFYEQLGIARLFAAIPQRQMLASFCQEQLGGLCFAREPNALTLKETLTHYLNHFGNQQHTAATLGVHRNTLAHRLKRIEKLTGHTLRDPFTRLNLQNALLIEQILFQHHNIDNETQRS